MIDHDDEYRHIGPTMRGTLRAQQSIDRAPSRVAQAVPSTGNTGAGSPSFEQKRQALEQAMALQLRDELVPHFIGWLSDYRAVNPHIGVAVPVVVLLRKDFLLLLDENDKHRWEDAYRFMFEHDYPRFLRLFMAVWAPKVPSPGSPSAAGRISPLTQHYDTPPKRFEDLGEADANIIVPRMASGGNPAGFYYERKATIYIRVGHVNGGTVAHEMCHAYTSDQWRSTLRSLYTYKLVARKIGVLSEGVTSELADEAIGMWKPGPTSLGRRKDAPSGYGGYNYEHKGMSSALMDLIGARQTARAYFGGALRLKIDDKSPARSVLIVDGKALMLATLFARAASDEGMYKLDYP